MLGPTNACREALTYLARHTSYESRKTGTYHTQMTQNQA